MDDLLGKAPAPNDGAMRVVTRPRRGGKTVEILRYAAAHFAYIVVPYRQDVDRLWGLARMMQLDIPQPITWAEFIEGRYHGRGVQAFVIDDLDRCLQSMTSVPIVVASLSGPVV